MVRMKLQRSIIRANPKSRYRQNRPHSITYKYDDLTTKIRSIPLNDRRVRIENLVGGNTPLHLFAGITETKLLNGSNSTETISFLQNGVKSFDVLLNGRSCHGFPLVYTVTFSIFYFFRRLLMNSLWNRT